MKQPWLWWKKEDLRAERQQSIDEGRDLSPAEPEFKRLFAGDVPEDAQFQTAGDNLLDAPSFASAVG
ncbi:hypothetical protein V2P20_01370 [Methylobacter sp. Wu1]|uniref:hypothetical protein n=1 Tax=Methylobacter sp. Wu1 TaxID=3119359 RepID=UPI002F936B71